MAENQIESAFELMKVQRYGEALYLLHQTIDREPTNWNAHYLAGQCCRFLDDIDGAIRNLSHATELKADEPSIHLALGIAFQLRMQWVDAIEAFRRAIEIDADYVLGYNSLALTQKQCGDLEEALHNYDAGVKALARGIVNTMQNSRSKPILKNRETVGELWFEYATYAALYLVSSVNDIDRMAWLSDEQALEEERTEKHAGLYWCDITTNRSEVLRVFLPNYFNSFREELKHSPEYSNLIGNRGTVLDLLGRDKEAHLHFNEATEFLPNTTIKQNTENRNEGTNNKPRTPFIQRGNEWDAFVGSKNWSELTTKEQNQFFVEQFTSESDEYWTQAIDADLKKSHAEGLRTLIVYIFIALQKSGFVDAKELTDENFSLLISESLDRIKIGRRIREFSKNITDNITDLSNSDLEFLSNIDETDAPFDDFYDFRDYLLNRLENCDSYADSPQVFVDHGRLIAEAAIRESKKYDQSNEPNRVVVNSKTERQTTHSGLFKKIFASPEVKLTVKSIKETVRIGKDKNIYGLSISCMDEIQKIAVKYAKESAETEEAISKENVAPNVLALVYLYRSSRMLLVSGNYHIYRGVLNQTGKDLHRIVIYFLNQLQNFGHISEVEKNQLSVEMATEIKNLE